MAPAADLLYFCDERWFAWHRDRVCAFGGAKVTLENASLCGKYPEIRSLKNDGEKGFAEEKNALRTGRNSGYQALHLAAHLGCKRILLLGYDMRIVQGRTHWHAGHQVMGGPMTGDPEYHNMLEVFPSIVGPLRERGIEVLNCTPGSALECFPIVSLREALECGPRRMTSTQAAS